MMPSPVDVGVDVAKHELQLAYAGSAVVPPPMANARTAIRARWRSR